MMPIKLMSVDDPPRRLSINKSLPMSLDQSWGDTDHTGITDQHESSSPITGSQITDQYKSLKSQ